jgi:hypothetical protein
MSFSISSAVRPRVTFYVRGDMFGANDQQHAVVDRLRELDATDRIEGYDVHVWNSRIRLTEEDPPPPVDRYREFEAWADDEGVDIEPFFTVRERDSFVDGTARELILPVMCLAVHDDDGLVAVAPNARGEETNTVQDCLDALDARETADRRVAAR